MDQKRAAERSEAETTAAAWAWPRTEFSPRAGSGTARDGRQPNRADHAASEAFARLQAAVETVEQALRESEARFAAFMRHLPGAAWLKDLAGRYTYANPEAERIFSTPGEHLRGKTDLEVFPPQTARQFRKNDQRVLREGGSLQTIEVLRQADGVDHRSIVSKFVVPGPDGRPVYVGGVAFDVTEWLAAEDAVRASEELQHQIEQRRRVESLLATENRILELIATGAALEDLLKTVCQAVQNLIPGSRCAIRLQPGPAGAGSALPISNGAEAAHGSPGVDVFGAVAEGVPLPPCAERTIVGSAETLSAAQGHGAWGRHGIRSYWLEPIRAATGETLGTLGVYSTESERPGTEALEASALAARLAALAVERARSQERELAQLAQLAHVARLATMGELASGLAHELNQPLCAIVNFAEACLELVDANGSDAKDLRKALTEVAKQAERAGAVIRRLREFVRRREPQREAVKLNDLVRDVVALTNAEARQHEVRIRLKLSKRLPRVFADPIQIQQVLVNLVRNAFDALRETDGVRRIVTIHTARRKGMVEVAVSDSGAGVTGETRERLFEPFFTTKSDGMGMGLSISRSILEVHDGRIWVESARENGATLRFTLPVARR